MEKIVFLNVDLVIESKEDLKQIVREFGEDVIVLHHGKIKGYNHALFEVSGSSAGPNELIAFFCSLIEGLSKEARSIWNNCCTRRFDIGYESGKAPLSYQSELKASTIERVSGAGASVAVTIYPIK